MKDTVAQLLDEDSRKALAEKLLDGRIADMVVIWREEGGIYWDGTMSTTAFYGALLLIAAVTKKKWVETEPEEGE